MNDQFVALGMAILFVALLVLLLLNQLYHLMMLYYKIHCVAMVVKLLRALSLFSVLTQFLLRGVILPTQLTQYKHHFRDYFIVILMMWVLMVPAILFLLLKCCHQ